MIATAWGYFGERGRLRRSVSYRAMAEVGEKSI